jgi:hypothetical protein
MDSFDSPRFRGSLVAGTILLAVGFIFLLNNFDFIYLGPVTHFWPLIIIAIGITKFFTADHPAEYRKGAWWVMMGFWFLISTLHLFGFSFHNSWPILLIVLGINSLWRALDPQSACRHPKGYHYAN